MNEADIAYMQQALTLARTNLGQTWPNPAVGAIVVKDGTVIGQGCTARGGRPHAETEALTQAGKNASGATLYVTLEPCSHHGKTPPCVDAIIAAGVARCVIACRDPHKQVNGAGIAKLKAAKIAVTENICIKEAQEINRGFFSVVEKNRPYVALKIATSADGKIAYPAGNEKKWITSEAAREEVHRLRSEFDAVLTGIGTVLADDPMLTCRIPGLEQRSPVRVVLDRKRRLPSSSKLMQSKNIVPLWVLDSPTLELAIEELTKKGITRLLVEAGQGLNTGFINSWLTDTVYWFKAPFEIGSEGLDAFSDMQTLPESWTKPGDSLSFPPDSLEIYERMDSGLHRNDKKCSPAS